MRLVDDLVTVEVYGDVLEGFEGVDYAFDADSGGILEAVGYGQGGHHHGQVSLDGLTLVVEDRAGSQGVLAHPKRLLDVPQLVAGGDNLGGVHQAWLVTPWWVVGGMVRVFVGITESGVWWWGTKSPYGALV